MTGRIGIENNGIAVIVTHVPTRRKPQLCLVIDNEEYPVAAFTSEGRADWFLGVMEEFLGGEFNEALRRHYEDTRMGS